MSDTCVFSVNSKTCCEYMTIAADVTEISYDDMKPCPSKIKAINFVHNGILTTIGASAFSGQPIKEIHFPSSLGIIGTSAFSSCESLETVGFDLARKLKTIESGAFYQTKVEHVKFPRQVVTIGSSCFLNCQSLQSLDFSKARSLVSIGSSCFYHCPILKLVTLFPPSLGQILEYAFYKCSSIENVTIPACANHLSIGYCAFEDCESLVRFEVEVGGNGIDFGNGAFSNCPALEVFSCYFDSSFDGQPFYTRNIHTVIFHGSPTESNPAVDIMSKLDYSAKPVFLVPRGCSIEGLTVATLEYYDPAPNPCKPTKQLFRKFRILIDKRFFCPYFMLLIG